MNSAQAFIAFLRCEATQAEERAKSLRATAATIEANNSGEGKVEHARFFYLDGLGEHDCHCDGRCLSGCIYPVPTSSMNEHSCVATVFSSHDGMPYLPCQTGRTTKKKRKREKVKRAPTAYTLFVHGMYCWSFFIVLVIVWKRDPRVVYVPLVHPWFSFDSFQKIMKRSNELRMPIIIILEATTTAKEEEEKWHPEISLHW